MSYPSMQGQVCLVTGATSGIGRATAHGLAQLGATVVVAGRSPAKAAATVAEIKSATGNTLVEALVADLSLMAGVRRLAEAFRASHDRLDVLVNNAGALFARRQETAEGLERTFALNHLSYFLLTNLLLDLLKASAPARIINVSSRAHQRVRGLDFDDLHNRRGYFAFRAYARSKLANLLFTQELARRLAGTGVTVNALHPGLVASGFGGSNGPLFALAYVFINALGQTPEQGADTVLYLAASPEVEGVTGQYFYQRRAVPAAPAAHDPAAARRLWEASERLAGLVSSQPGVV